MSGAREKKNLLVNVGLSRDVNHGEEAPRAGDFDPITVSSFIRMKFWCDDVDYNFIASGEDNDFEVGQSPVG